MIMAKRESGSDVIYAETECVTIELATANELERNSASMMEKRTFTTEKDGFNGAWYPTHRTKKAFVMMLGDDSEDYMARCGVKYLQDFGFSVMAMSPGKKDYGHHNYPLERFDTALDFMKKEGMEKFGIIGASTTGMAALAAASFFSDFTLTIALSPCDFIMEGFYQDGKDGMKERPGDNESTLSYRGRPLPYLPYAYRHPEYWKQIEAYSKETGNFIASRKLFDDSEKLHPLKEEEKIRVERIKGKIVFIGAEDDCLWDTCRYIRRMEDRLSKKEHECTYEAYLYEHGTHFVFPQSMLKRMLPVGSSLLVGMMFKDGRKYAKECKETRINIDRRLRKVLGEF